MTNQQPRSTATTVVSTVVLTIVILIVLGIGGYLFYENQNRTNLGKEEGSFGAPQTSTSETQTTETEPTETSETETPDPEPTVREDEPASDNTGLTPGGWDDSTAHCFTDDRWVYAARGDGDYVVVCQVGDNGDYYYRSDVAGLALEHDVDMGSVDEGRGFYEIPIGDGTTIVIDGDRLDVFDADGAHASAVHFEEHHLTN